MYHGCITNLKLPWDVDVRIYEKVWAGVDIGGTKTAVVLSSNPPVVLKRIEFPTHSQNGPGPAVKGIIRAIHEALVSQQLTPADLHAIGVSCGSPQDPVAGVIQAPPNLSTWIDVPITSLLSNEFGVQCHLENDANAGALAEYHYGAGKGSRSMVFLTMGTGLGAGLILDGRLYRGITFAAGEIGHVRLTRSGPVGYHKAGSAEGWASGAGMAQIATRSVQRALERGQTTTLTKNGDGANGVTAPLSAREVWMQAQQGDVIAQNIIRNSGRKLGEALAILIDLLNPDCIVIGGLAMRMGDAILGPARDVARRESLVASFDACRIVAARLDEEIGDVASLCIAMGETKS